ncbi:hypothetical protein [Psychrobacter sp. FDAARGOS_221]|uniref:hypothetical protein n=1 Tax=Psychrobacter sp. FDAARGOS_221 TaxID=1975705 RepID=UPI000BB54739|nr:hypothetical protein [Psychrobacter sp. FDAARGOS_221]PNK60364.1 hypothetical protein A6J60_005410 [Psychrobacter sp. FDAARGOS_221]
MGIWVAAVIGLFALGCMMALKPSVVEVRVDKLRMAARRLDLNPKLIACPSWVRGRQDEYGKGMIAQYSLILDDYKFTETCYEVHQGTLQPRSCAVDGTKQVDGAKRDDSKRDGHDNTPRRNDSAAANKLAVTGSLQQQAVKRSTVINQSLQDEPLQLPKQMQPLIKAVYLKANSLVVFWHDTGYVQPKLNPDYDAKQAEQDLEVLKAKMLQWAQHASGKSSQ